jgi:hypothetical protein
MGIRLTSFGVGRLAAFVLCFFAYGVYTVYRGVDHWLHYSRVPAVVDSIGERCRPAASNRARREALSRDPVWAHGAWGDCSAARRYVSGDGQLHVESAEVAAIRYVSPADRREHSGMLDLRQVSDVKAVTASGSVAILAHDTEPLTFDPA